GSGAALRAARAAAGTRPGRLMRRALSPAPALRPRAYNHALFRRNRESAMRICVYCASSEHVHRAYHDVAARLGRTLAEAGCTVVYGGGAVGLMGTLANAALDAGGEVIGVIPRFMIEVEWQHPGLANLEIVEDMRERKHRLLTGSDAVVALPGGCGTLEELFEAMTLKRLALYFKPIVLL